LGLTLKIHQVRLYKVIHVFLTVVLHHRTRQKNMKQSNQQSESDGWFDFEEDNDPLAKPQPARSAVLARAQEINRRFLSSASQAAGPDDEIASYKEPEAAPVAKVKNAREPSQAQRNPSPPLSSKEEQVDDSPEEEEEQAIVTPEMLVDALSGHEDGLLAIAERLMEHYDGGYDVMGEAIIDAFADVQKLFQHVVEAAHMEGAAFEANRAREDRERSQDSGMSFSYDAGDGAGSYTEFPSEKKNRGKPQDQAHSPAGPTRHDEIIDSDVRDLLKEALSLGSQKLSNREYVDAYATFENACHSASSLLPVDSDHRGRLQLSIARAESMSPDKGCAILRYAMDDVLRSGLRPTGKVEYGKRNDYRQPLPGAEDEEQLSEKYTGEKPVSANDDHYKGADSNHHYTPHFMQKKNLAESIRVDAGGRYMQASGAPGYSHEEALSSIVAEFKEFLGAPMYENTPVQDISRRFWNVLANVQLSSAKREEELENELGRIKGEFLLAKAEWEEKLSEATSEVEVYKEKYLEAESAKQQQYMEQARSSAAKLPSQSFRAGFESPSMSSRKEKASSVASFGSGLAQHARSVVDSLSCYGAVDKRSTGSMSRHAASSSTPSMVSASSATRSSSSKGTPLRGMKAADI